MAFASIGSDVTSPIVATWEGTIADDAALYIAIDSSGGVSAVIDVSGVETAQTLGTLSGVSVAGPILEWAVIVKTSSAADSVARIRYLPPGDEAGEWDTSGGDAALVAGSAIAYRGGFKGLPLRGEGQGGTVLTVAGYASDAPAAARAAVDVYVEIGFQGAIV